MESPEQHDLAVEVVGLDGADAALQALPRRPALASLATDAVEREVIGPPLEVLRHRRPIDASSVEDGLRFGGDELGEVAAA